MHSNALLATSGKGSDWNGRGNLNWSGNTDNVTDHWSSVSNFRNGVWAVDWASFVVDVFNNWLVSGFDVTLDRWNGDVLLLNGWSHDGLVTGAGVGNGFWSWDASWKTNGWLNLDWSLNVGGGNWDALVDGWTWVLQNNWVFSSGNDVSSGNGLSSGNLATDTVVRGANLKFFKKKISKG